MSESTGGANTALLLRLSVPASGGLRSIAMDLASKAASFAGTSERDAESVAADLERMLERVAPAGKDADIIVEFRSTDEALVIAARSGGRDSELKYPLPE